MEIEESVIADIRARRDLGRRKYGKSMERDDLTELQWCKHHYEELLDSAIYVKRRIRDLEIKVMAPELENSILDPELREYLKHGSLEC